MKKMTQKEKDNLFFTNFDPRRRQEESDGKQIAPDYAIPANKARCIIKEFDPNEHTNEFLMFNPVKKRK